MGGVEDDKTRKAKEIMIERTRSAAGSGKPPVYDMIGKRLREYYDEVAAQPVPERFVDLLKQLDSKTAAKKGH
ncbi:MAG: NepR family anti-sigma factor [Hyphomicrobiales bacterium]